MGYLDNFYVDIFDDLLSDVHSPICLSIKSNFKPIVEEEVLENLTSDIDYKPVYTKWDPELKQNYQNNFDMINIEQLSKSLDILLESGTSQSKLDDKLNVLTTYVLPLV